MNVVGLRRNWAYFVAVSSLAVLPSCGGSPSKQAGQATDKSKDWFSALVDEQTDSTMRVRPKDLASDSFAGPLTGAANQQATTQIKDPAGAAYVKVLMGCDVVVVAVRKTVPNVDAFVIAGGIPATSTPDTMVDDAQKPFWKKIDSPVPSVDEWQLVAGDADQQAARLAVLPGNTWVLAGSAVSVERMNAAFTGGTPAAYAPDAEGGGKGLLQMSVTGDTLEKARADAPPAVQPVVGTLKRGVVRIDGGSTPGAHAVLTYADATNATQSAQFITKITSGVPALKLLGNFQVASASSDVTIDLPISESIRDLIIAQASGAGSGGGDTGDSAAPPAPSNRPQPIAPPSKKKKKKKGH